jgi:hypothetical protein
MPRTNACAQINLPHLSQSQTLRIQHKHTQNRASSGVIKKVCVFAQIKVPCEVIVDRLQRSIHVFVNQPDDRRSAPSVVYPTVCFTSLDSFDESVSLKKKTNFLKEEFTCEGQIGQRFVSQKVFEPATTTEIRKASTVSDEDCMAVVT